MRNAGPSVWACTCASTRRCSGGWCHPRYLKIGCDKFGVSFFISFSSIFGHEGQDADDVVYINWLSMVRAGLLGLEFYTPESRSWRQVMPTLLPSVMSRFRSTRSSSVHFFVKGLVLSRVYAKGQRAGRYRCVPYRVTGLDLCLLQLTQSRAVFT